MKSMLVGAVLVLCFMSMPAQAQVSGNIELQNVISADGIVPQINVYIRGPLKGRLGWTIWTLSSKGWSEALPGLTFAPAKWVEVSASLGLETNKNPLRGAASIWVGRGRASFVSLQEGGGSGHWQKNVGVVQLTKVVSVGVLQQTFIGTGPYTELKIGKVSVWGSYALDDRNGQLAVKYNF